MPLSSDNNEWVEITKTTDYLRIKGVLDSIELRGEEALSVCLCVCECNIIVESRDSAVDTLRNLNVYKTSIGHRRHRIDVL